MSNNLTTYTATIEGVADDTPCQCDDCGTIGQFSELDLVEDAVLTPGHPSPAGRCPLCGSLAYVIEPEEEKMRISLDGGVTFIESKYLCVDLELEGGRSLTLSFENKGDLQADLWLLKNGLEICANTKIFHNAEEIAERLMNGAH